MFQKTVAIVTGLVIGSMLFNAASPYLLPSNRDIENYTSYSARYDLDRPIYPTINNDTTFIDHSVMISYTDEDFMCLARNIFFEAGVESNYGKMAVAQVTLNRVKAPRWGDSICEVVFARNQFSWTRDSSKQTEIPSGPLWNESVRIATLMLKYGLRLIPLQSALFYHADYINRPSWADPAYETVKIGTHIFYDKARRDAISLATRY